MIKDETVEEPQIEAADAIKDEETVDGGGREGQPPSVAPPWFVNFMLKSISPPTLGKPLLKLPSHSTVVNIFILVMDKL
jgi:hypothetical protein